MEASRSVLILSSEFPPGPGGIGNHAWQLARHLAELGWRPAVISPQDYAGKLQIDAFNRVQGFPVIGVPSGIGAIKGFTARYKTARKAVKDLRPDSLIGTGQSGVWLTAALRRKQRLPAIAVAHGSEFVRQGTAYHFNRLAFSRMDAVVAVSQFTSGLVKGANIAGPRLEVITNAADASRFQPWANETIQAFKARHGVTARHVIVTVGHVSERKGQETIIRALPSVLKRAPETHYYMVGLPTLKERFASLAAELGVRDHVHFEGVVSPDDMLGWLNCCDVFAMTSCTLPNGDCEGFGIAVVEAALCGKPAVVSRQSGLMEAIVDQVTGIGVPERDAEATAEAISSLLTEANKRETMGASARSRAMQEQTWQKCSAKYDCLLRTIMNPCAS